jgi:hypothetical protein
MARLIDADALCENIKKQYCERCKAQGKDYKEILCRACDIDDMRIQTEDAPTVDAVPVVHGRWRMETDEEEPNPLCKVLVCSVCGKMGGRNFCYCPNCGSKMDEKE